MKTVKIIYLYSLKGNINRFKQHPVKMFLILLAASVIIFFPAALIGESAEGIQIPYKWIILLSSAFFSRFSFKIFMKGNDFKAIPQDFIYLLTVTPEKVKKLYCILVMDTFVKSCVSYLVLYSLFYLYTGGEIFYLILNLIIVIILISVVTFLSGIISVVSTYVVPVVVRIFFLFYSVVLMGSGIYTFLKDKNIPVHMALGNYIFANSVKYVLGDGYSARAYIKALFMAVLLLVITTTLFFILLRSSKLSAFHIIESNYYNKTGKSGNLMIKISSKFFFLPEKMRLLMSKELVQIWRERSPLLSVIVQSVLAGLVMLISAKTFEGEIIRLGLIVIMAYETFLLSLFSIPRELKCIWNIKVMNTDWMILIRSKFLACYIGSFILSVPICILYMAAAYLLIPVHIVEFLNTYLLGLITIVPLSISLGFIMSTFMPFDIVDKKKKVTYKFNGLEGAMLLILVFLAVVPTWVMMENKEIFIIVLIYVLYAMALLCISFLCAKRKLGKL